MRCVFFFLVQPRGNTNIKQQLASHKTCLILVMGSLIKLKALRDSDLRTKATSSIQLQSSGLVK